MSKIEICRKETSLAVMVDSALPVVVFKVSIQFTSFIHIYFTEKILVFHFPLLDKLLLDKYDSGAKSGPFLGFICLYGLQKKNIKNSCLKPLRIGP